MTQLVWVLLIGLGAVAVVQVVGLVLGRVGREAHERRQQRRHQAVRAVILTALLGEPDEAGRARAELRGRSGGAWSDVEEQAFAMIPKIKGESHDALVTLLLSKGASTRAAELARSRSQVARARAAHRLGALAQGDAVPVLLTLLRDHTFLVRRTAVRALGQVADPLAVPALLDALTADPHLTRDVLGAIDRIGPQAAPVLRRELAQVLTDPEENRRAALTATGLGVLGDVSAVGLLTVALEDREQPGLAVAAAEALGAVGSPEAVDPLCWALEGRGDDVRAAAATALGAVGDASATERLVAALDDEDHLTSRAVAAALLRLGEPGRHALETSPSPYAAEALAVHRVRLGV